MTPTARPITEAPHATSSAPRPGQNGAEGAAEGPGFDLYLLALCLSTLVLMMLCWPLWLDAGTYPRVPFVRGVPALSAGQTGWLVGGLCVACLGIASNIERQTAATAAIGLLGVLILGDQARLQPWVYQFLLTALTLATIPRRWQPSFVRLIVAAIYAHSALSKLDHAFACELGPLFLRALFRIIHLDSRVLTDAQCRAAALALPSLELAVAVLLCCRHTRRIGVGAAMGMHALLVVVLGPPGLDHSATVVGWNAAMLVEVPLLFWRESPPHPGRMLGELARTAGVWVMLTLLAMPFLERLGYWDSWPSFAVYASHNERIEILVPRAELDLWPPGLARFLVETPVSEYLQFDLTNWSRFTRGVPPYPQARTAVGAALALAHRIPSATPFQARLLGRAQWLTGSRTILAAGGPADLEAAAARFFWNAHPAEAASRWERPDRSSRHSATQPLDHSIDR